MFNNKDLEQNKNRCVHHVSKLYGISGRALTWIRSLVINRFQSIKIRTVPVFCVVPLGYMFRPLLFILYATSLSSLFHICYMSITPYYTSLYQTANLLVSSLLPYLIIASHRHTLYVILVIHLIAILISENIFL